VANLSPTMPGRREAPTGHDRPGGGVARCGSVGAVDGNPSRLRDVATVSGEVVCPLVLRRRSKPRSPIGSVAPVPHTSSFLSVLVLLFALLVEHAVATVFQVCRKFPHRGGGDVAEHLTGW
jgi:hypothetical protein